jgi:hypothetical protein
MGAVNRFSSCPLSVEQFAVHHDAALSESSIAQSKPESRVSDMLISGELYAALKEAGASDGNAQAAAALLATHELRILRIEALHREVLRWGAILGVSGLVSLFITVAFAIR